MYSFISSPNVKKVLKSLKDELGKKKIGDADSENIMKLKGLIRKSECIAAANYLKLPEKNLHYLFNLNYLIIDCLKIDKHPSHLNYEQAIKLIKLVKPKKSILTNLHTDMDYFKLKKKLPKDIIPAFDGLNFRF